MTAGKPLCSVPGCARRAHARGWCELHYSRWRRTGDTEKRTGGVKPRPAAERFASHYAVDRVTGCWVWTGTVNNRGYGRFDRGYAHRASWEIHRGPIPPGLVIDHLCENRMCVNPAHLRTITNRQNILSSSSPSVQRYWLNVCIRGHDLTDPANVYRRPRTGHRTCLACQRIVSKAWRARRRAERDGRRQTGRPVEASGDTA